MGGFMKTKIVPEILINDDGSMHEDCIVRLKMVQIIEGEELVDFMKERIQKCINELKYSYFVMIQNLFLVYGSILSDRLKNSSMFIMNWVVASYLYLSIYTLVTIVR